VAVLDTGVDIKHEEIRFAHSNGKIMVYRGFPESLDPLNDRHGRGTHGASVLLRTAPNTALYVARIADDTGIVTQQNNYSDVVNVILL